MALTAPHGPDVYAEARDRFDDDLVAPLPRRPRADRAPAAAVDDGAAARLRERIAAAQAMGGEVQLG